MKQHSDTAWKIASKFSHVLASETRDLAAHIDVALDEKDLAITKALEYLKDDYFPHRCKTGYSHQEIILILEVAKDHNR